MCLNYEYFLRMAAIVGKNVIKAIECNIIDIRTKIK